MCCTCIVRICNCTCNTICNCTTVQYVIVHSTNICNDIYIYIIVCYHIHLSLLVLLLLLFVCMCICVCIYIYIYIERSRILSLSLSLNIYIYIYSHTACIMCVLPAVGVDAAVRGLSSLLFFRFIVCSFVFGLSSLLLSLLLCTLRSVFIISNRKTSN